MSANTAPIYTLTPDVSNNGTTGNTPDLTTATGDYTGQSANHVLAHTAGPNGSFIKRLRFKAKGTNVASVARVYLNNGLTPATAANNIFVGECALPASTATNTDKTPDVDYPMEFAIPAGWRVYVGLGTTVAAGWTCCAIAGQY
jgi:hypothetical protein